MNVGINSPICQKIDCENYIEDWECSLKKCPRSDRRYNSNFYRHRCPLPEKCLYKNLHIINKIPVRGLVGCPDECKKLVGIK